MRNAFVIGVLALLVAGGYLVYQQNTTDIEEEAAQTQQELAVDSAAADRDGDRQPTRSSLADGPTVTPIEHASFVLSWADTTIYVDPVGELDRYENRLAPDLVLLTHSHGDHLSPEILEGVVARDTIIIAPQAVYAALPEVLAAQTQVIANGETATPLGLTIEAIPMYNLPAGPDAYHSQGEGNGYVVDDGTTRVYIAGDTGSIPEMRDLTDIDMAFVPMNQPYTMTVEAAADAVSAFAPRTVIPYHYRGQDGFSDVERFKEIVELQNPSIQVLLLNWYPDAGTETAAEAET